MASEQTKMAKCRYIVLIWLAAIMIPVLVLASASHNSLPDFVSIKISKSGGAYVFSPQEVAEQLWSGIFKPLLKFISNNLDKIVSWPFVTLIIFMLIYRSKIFNALISFTQNRLKTFNAFGISLELNDQIRELKKESDELFKFIPAIRESITSDIRTHIGNSNIQSSMVRLIKSISEEIKSKNPHYEPERCRATIHIRDPLFLNRTMQLLEYIDGNGNQLSGLTIGRSYSIRRGIVGQSWRSQLAIISGVLPEPEEQSTTEDKKIRHIAKIWGMTINEARHALKYPSCISIPFTFNNNCIGIFYMDSTIQDAFISKDLHNYIENFIYNELETSRLRETIASIEKLLPQTALMVDE